MRLCQHTFSKKRNTLFIKEHNDSNVFELKLISGIANNVFAYQFNILLNISTDGMILFQEAKSTNKPIGHFDQSIDVSNMATEIKNGSLLKEYLSPNALSHYSSEADDLISEATILDDYIMEKGQNQQRLYVINRSGTGEAQYVLLNQKQTAIQSFGVRYETWRAIQGISNFGVAVVDNVLYVIGGYDIKTCRHLHRVVK